MNRRSKYQTSEPFKSTLSKHEALSKIQEKLAVVPTLRNNRYDCQGFQVWQRDTLTLIGYIFGRTSENYTSFQCISYSPMFIGIDTSDSCFQSNYVSGLQTAEAMLTSFKNEIAQFFPDDAAKPVPKEGAATPSCSKVFIVHGRDEAAREKVARFVEHLDLTPIILNEQPNNGNTVIEKLEANSDLGFAIVLLTGDDVGNLRTQADKLNPRARQNVILELGYFIAKLGRDRVCALSADGIERPSDFNGVVYVPFDTSEGWKIQLVRELKSAGFKVDANKAF